MADLVAIDPLVANCGGLRLIGRPSSLSDLTENGSRIEIIFHYYDIP
jgi:hypothetical protein